MAEANLFKDELIECLIDVTNDLESYPEAELTFIRNHKEQAIPVLREIVEDAMYADEESLNAVIGPVALLILYEFKDEKAVNYSLNAASLFSDNDMPMGRAVRAIMAWFINRLEREEDVEKIIQYLMDFDEDSWGRTYAFAGLLQRQNKGLLDPDVLDGFFNDLLNLDNEKNNAFKIMIAASIAVDDKKDPKYHNIFEKLINSADFADLDMGIPKKEMLENLYNLELDNTNIKIMTNHPVIDEDVWRLFAENRMPTDEELSGAQDDDYSTETLESAITEDLLLNPPTDEELEYIQKWLANLLKHYDPKTTNQRQLFEQMINKWFEDGNDSRGLARLAMLLEDFLYDFNDGDFGDDDDFNFDGDKVDFTPPSKSKTSKKKRKDAKKARKANRKKNRKK